MDMTNIHLSFQQHSTSEYTMTFSMTQHGHHSVNRQITGKSVGRNMHFQGAAPLSPLPRCTQVQTITGISYESGWEDSCDIPLNVKENKFSRTIVTFIAEDTETVHFPNVMDDAAASLY